MKKADTIAAWEKESKPAAIEEAIAKTSFDAAYGEICCIGWAFDDEAPQSVSRIAADDEKATVLRFFQRLEQGYTHQSPTIVGHYVAGFDIRFITRRCMILGIRLPSFWPLDPKPWDDKVFDTMTAWSGVRDTISMENLCQALGIPGKGDIDGSMVAQLFAEGKHEVIADYCRGDICRTREIHKKMLFTFGEAA
ncbi:ribonuclease H-like domain-containing protein [Rhizobium sp. 21-4511-3d]